MKNPYYNTQTRHIKNGISNIICLIYLSEAGASTCIENYPLIQE